MNRRITKPPGGETNEIFTNTTPQSTPPSTPRKIKNYMASNIFNPDVQGGMPSAEPRNIRHRPDDDSFKRLFGNNGGGDMTDSPRGKNHQKSSIIFADAGVNGKANGTNGHANGTNGHSNGTNGHSANGTNGHHANGTNGTNGHGHENGSGSSTPNGNTSNGGTNGVNGHAKTNGTNGTHEVATNGGSNGTPTKRIPPGGFSSKLW